MRDIFFDVTVIHKWLFIYLSIYLFIYLFICLFIYLDKIQTLIQNVHIRNTYKNIYKLKMLSKWFL